MVCKEMMRNGMTVNEALEKLFNRTLSDIEVSVLAAVLASASGKNIEQVKDAVRVCKQVSTIQSFKRCVKKKLGMMPPAPIIESGLKP